MVQISDIYNFHPIDEMLSTSGQPTDAQLRIVAAEGYKVIINLALHDEPRYSLPDEKRLVEGLGMEYIHIPVQFDNPQEEELLIFFRTMEAQKHKKILVHCAANMRVSAFLGLYRLIKQGMDECEAFEPMRSVWIPDEVWSSFISTMLAKHESRGVVPKKFIG